MNKYFLAYAGGGCLMAIALSSFLTEYSRLVPVAWQILIIFWGLSALFFGAWLRSKEDDFEMEERYTIFMVLYLLVNVILGIGVCFGLY